MIMGEILELLNVLPYWQQVLADEILKGKSITNDDLDKFYFIFKQENKLEDEPLIKKNINFNTNFDSPDVSTNIEWKSLSNIRGVNAINNDAILNIGNQLTLIYGENGSGKSGYTRLLNNIFISRGDKKILPNIFNETEVIPSAKIIFEEESGVIQELAFPDDKNHPYLKRVAVFDTFSANHDLTKESELKFSPMEFHFFDKFLDYIEYIKTKFENEITSKSMENEFINYFEKETSVKEAVKDLNAKTNLDNLKKIVKITNSDTEKFKVKVEQKTKLKALNLDVKLVEYKKLISGIEGIKIIGLKLNNIFSQTKLFGIKKLLEEKDRYEKLSLEEGVSQFKNEHIENIGSSEWREFIKSAYSYYRSINNNADYCIFCRQDIKGVTIIDKYWKYLKSEVEKNSNSVNEGIKREEKIYSSLESKLFTRESKLEEWIKDNQNDLYQILIEAEKNFAVLNEKVISSLNSLKWDGDISSYSLNLECLNSAIDLLNENILKLDSDKIEKDINKIEKFEDEYNAKLQIEKFIPQIESFILNSYWVDLAEKRKISTQKITLYQKKLFSKYVTKEYIDKFDEECKKLKSNFSAEITQRGSKGTTLNKLTLKGRKPVDILSEGEQRSIALANFLAEISINNDNICVIFDDPVSSLDYKRREVIASRLVAESKEKQVVIFTHDLTFLLSMQERCLKEKINCFTYSITKIQQTTGIVDSSIPWIGMPVKNRIGYLKEKLQKIEKTYKNVTPDTFEDMKKYQEEAKFWCEELRETWERTIEEILFNNAVQRYSSAIQTQRLKSAPFTIELYEKIDEGMKNCSNWVHDRAVGLGEGFPDPEDLKKYIDDCESFIKANRA